MCTASYFRQPREIYIAYYEKETLRRRNTITTPCYTFSLFRHVIYPKGIIMARYYYRRARGYGLSNFVGDLCLTAVTGGLWLIWIIIREVSR